MKWRSRARLVVPCAVLGVAIDFAASARAAEPTAKTTAKKPAQKAKGAPASDSMVPCPTPQHCDAPCTQPPCPVYCNTPFQATKCWTTSCGPAAADVIVAPASTGPVPPNATQSTNMLYCNGNAYALCFFSGPPHSGIANQPDMPCKWRPGEHLADCICQYFSSGANFVDINGILNLGAYFETVDQCGADGHRCQNITVCGQDGTKSGCGDYRVPPVCRYIQNQPSGNPATSFYPHGNVISTFSFALSPPYALATNPPQCAGPYAGCMTAPCFFTDSKPSHSDGDKVVCECPVATGTYQVGENGKGCTIPYSGKSQYVWSASNTVVGSCPSN